VINLDAYEAVWGGIAQEKKTPRTESTGMPFMGQGGFLFRFKIKNDGGKINSGALKGRRETLYRQLGLPLRKTERYI